jgi:nucleoporin p58/p45
MFNTALGGSSIGGGVLGGGLGSTLQQQSVPGVKIDLANLRGTSRFGDLHEDLQKLVEEIDKGIVAQTELHKQVDAMMPGHEQNLMCIPNDVEFVSRRLTTMQHALENDAQAIDYVRKTVKKDANDARLSFRALDNLKLPPQYHYQGLWSSPTPSAPPRTATGAAAADDEGSTDLVAYFSQQADDMAQTLEKYKRNLQEIEEGLRGVEAKTVQMTQKLMLTKGEDGRERNEAEVVSELSQVLRTFEGGILSVAGSVWMAREGVQELTVGAGGAGGRDGRRVGVY